VKVSPRLRLALVLSLVLFGSVGASKPATAVNPMDPAVWEIGPIIAGQNYSVNMPLSPSPHPQGWSFDFPQPDKAAGHVHYLTFKHGSLTGKTRILLRYRIEAEPGVQFFPTNYPGSPSILSLYFQRRGDNWSGTGRFEAYRWWSTFRTHTPLTPGEHELLVGLEENWTAVQSSTASNNLNGFRAAIRDAERVGFAFGGGDGFGHGVYATGPARFVVTSFQVLP